ncbi:MAG: ATP-binding protein [Carboxylicivirga sp.]|jgi:NadR type nicotinamide-nucleotide adenylyltransferase|nr:ATP-binding protein [Carboxylicivirga sp.]
MQRQSDQPLIVVLSGPESTGKSTLAKQLAECYHTDWIPEYAREYVENINRPYTFEDVRQIAHKQISQYEDALELKSKLVFFDTFLIITKVWFKEVYGTIPSFIDDFLKLAKIDLHLLCYPDIQWINDGLRENESKRLYLHELYKQELNYYQFNYQMIKGQNKQRSQQAKQYIDQLLKAH